MNLNLFSRRKAKRFRTMVGGGITLLLVAVVLVGVWQLDTIRDFLSRASGEKADLVVNTKAIIGPMPRPWRNLAQGGEDHAWRIQPIQNQVKNLHPEYIRLDHIYDFYDIVQGSPGNLNFDFSKFDLIIDDILAAGAKPYIALSYMPPAISSGDIISPPQNWHDWQVTVQRTIEHVSGARGIKDVYYEVWNEPDLFGGWKYYGNKNYLTMYTYAAQGAANARNVQPFKIGGPATTALYKNWFDALAKHAIKNNLRYDFFSWHHYTTDIEDYQRDIQQVRSWISQYPQLEPTLEFHLTEWGHDSENHAGYDTSYGAAHTVAGAIEMVAVIQRAFVFEIQDGKDPAGQAAWGRWGLLQHTDSGASTKPRYRGLQMLDGIANQRLQITGTGSWVKALAARDENNNTQVVIANYDQRGRNVENVPLTFENITPGNYLLTTKYLNGQNNTQQVATTAGVLKTFIPMPVNSVATVQLSQPTPPPTPQPQPAKPTPSSQPSQR